MDNRNNFFVLGEAHKGMGSKANRNAPFALQDLFARRQISDDRNSFLGLEDVHARLETEGPETDAEATDINACMAWVTFYLTDAVERNDSHATRLMLDVGVGCGLLYTQYRHIATLIDATAGALRATTASNDGHVLKTLFDLAGPFVSDADDFVAQMLDHGRTVNQCGLLLEFGLMNMVQPSQRGALLDGTLRQALLNKDDKAVEALLSTGECDPNQFVSGRPALVHCICSSQQRSLRALLNTGKCDLNLADPSNGMTPLMQAAWQGSSAYARALLKTSECQLNDANAVDGMTPLFYAAIRGHTGVVRELLAGKHCDVNTPHRHGKTALDMAGDGRHQETVDFLTSHRDVNVPDGFGNKAWNAATAKLKGLHRLLEALREDPLRNVDLPDNSTHSPSSLEGTAADAVVSFLACQACETGYYDWLCFNCKSTVQRIDKSGKYATCFKAALARQIFGVANDLLREFVGDESVYSSACEILVRGYRGVDVSGDGMTPLMLAAGRSPDNHPILTALLDTKRCDVNEEDNDGWTALMHARGHGKTWHVRSLLRTERCKIDEPSNGNPYTTVLHMAACSAQPSFLRELLKRTGLDLRVSNDLGQTPLIVATLESKRDNVELLLGYETGYGLFECGFYMISPEGNTALSTAVQAGDYEMVCLLVNSGRVTDLDDLDKDGKHLSLVARELGDTGIERVLSEHAATLRSRGA
jgi:ankyrin repeat protein